MATVHVSENVLASDLKLNVKIEIQNGKKGFFPEIVDSVTWTTERKDTPGKLVFSVLWDSKLDIEEGNPVKLTVKGTVVFYGFIFTFSHTKSTVVQITAYDQIRYLLNKDTYTTIHTDDEGYYAGETYPGLMGEQWTRLEDE